MVMVLLVMVVFKTVTKQQGSQTIDSVLRRDSGFKTVTKQQGSQTPCDSCIDGNKFKTVTKQQGSQTYH